MKGFIFHGLKIPENLTEERLCEYLELGWQRNKNPRKKPYGWRKYIGFYMGQGFDTDEDWSEDDYYESERSSTPLSVEEAEERDEMPELDDIQSQLSINLNLRAPEAEVEEGESGRGLDMTSKAQNSASREASLPELLPIESQKDTPSETESARSSEPVPYVEMVEHSIKLEKVAKTPLSMLLNIADAKVKQKEQQLAQKRKSASSQNEAQPAKKYRRSGARQSSIVSFTAKNRTAVVRTIRKFEPISSTRPVSPASSVDSQQSTLTNDSEDRECQKCGWIDSIPRAFQNILGLRKTAMYEDEHKHKHELLRWRKKTKLATHKCSFGEIQSGSVLSMDPEVKPLLEFVDELLGEYVRTAPRRVFCAIHNGMVIGIVAWQCCKKAMLGRIGEEGQIWQLAGQERFNVKVAIDRIWVAPGWRRKGLATFLLDNILYPTKIDKELICFSDPTADGSKFATKYFNGRVLIAE